MAKAMLIMDMPDSCGTCPLRFLRVNYVDVCKGVHRIEYDNLWGKTIDTDTRFEKPSWCPLQEVPNRVEGPPMNGANYEAGYNACIDEILGGDKQ